MILCGDFSTALLRLKDGYRVRRERSAAIRAAKEGK